MEAQISMRELAGVYGVDLDRQPGLEGALQNLAQADLPRALELLSDPSLTEKEQVQKAVVGCLEQAARLLSRVEGADGEKASLRSSAMNELVGFLADSVRDHMSAGTIKARFTPLLTRVIRAVAQFDMSSQESFVDYLRSVVSGED